MADPAHTPPPTPSALKVKPRVIVKGLALLISLTAIGWGVREADLIGLFDKAWIDQAVRGQGVNGELLFLAVGAVFTAVGLPRQVVGFLGGYAFGVWIGTGLALVATVVGCVATFVYARFFGRGVVRHKFSGRIRKVDDFLHDNPFSMTLLIRFLPVGSNMATNLIAGVSSVRPMPFFAGSAVGYLPQTIVAALLGGGVAEDGGFLKVALGVALFVASAFLGVYLFRRFRHGKKLGADIDGLVAANGEAAADTEPPTER